MKMVILKNLLLVFFALLISYLISPWVGALYQNVTNDPGTWADVASIFGLVVAYIFLITLLLTAFGGQKKYWWIIILLIPAAIFEVYFDFSHIYFPILLGLLGWLIGFGISRFFSRPNPQV